MDCHGTRVSPRPSGTHLDVFSIQVLVQRKALDRAFVPTVKGPQLQPLVGGVPEGTLLGRHASLSCPLGRRTLLPGLVDLSAVSPFEIYWGSKPVTDGDQEVFGRGGEELKVSDVQTLHLDRLAELDDKPVGRAETDQNTNTHRCKDTHTHILGTLTRSCCYRGSACTSPCSPSI